MILLTSSFQNVMQLMGVVLIFLIVLALTYFTARWIGGYQQINMKNKNLQILESIKVGTNKFICLIKAGEIYLVVAVGKDEITMLAQLTEEQLSVVPSFSTYMTGSEKENLMSADNFQEVLEKMKQFFPKK
jgi:flagellar protein FliO/FliZ